MSVFRVVVTIGSVNTLSNFPEGNSFGAKASDALFPLKWCPASRVELTATAWLKNWVKQVLEQETATDSNY